jgi:uncharacterized protein involved in type VI secretion and phage assembly
MNLNEVDTTITVDGKSCDFTTLSLDQLVAGHHKFEIAVNYRHKDQSVWAATPDDIFRETLGKPVSIVMKHAESGETNEFDGVVTDIEIVGVDGDDGTVVLKGGSPTLLLDRDPAMASFVDYSLYNVVAETIEKTGITVELDNKPALQRTIPYLARYRETSWGFLSRVLYSFGEWFYYDGKKLIVGNPQNQQERRVTYDMELLEVQSTAGLRNLNTKYYEYDPAENSYFEEASAGIDNANLPMKGAKQTADNLYTTAAKLPVGREVLGESDMSAIVRTRQSREYTKMSIFTASCNTCGVRVGEIATALIPEDFADVKFTDFGAFRVLEVHHRIDKEKHYSNIFKGIASQTETLPDDNISAPTAFPEPATVVDNADPRNQGRVRVRYFWQAEDASTNWIRVQTPDAGKSDAVSKNRGMVFIPEIDDQVMIGFIQGDPARPYVMGSLFHRDNSSGAATDNTIKSIATRSGHIIEFNDDEAGAWGITIKDRNGNLMHLDTVGKNITITTPETMTLNAKNMIFEVAENINVKAGKNITTVADGDIVSESTGETAAKAGGGFTATAGKDITMRADAVFTADIKGNANVKAADIEIKGSGKLNVSGEEASVVGQSSTLVKGATYKIELK